MYDIMDFEDESSASSSSSSSYVVISTHPSNPSSQTNPSAISHKRKAGRKKFRETRHPIYRGVRQRNGDKWVCEVRKPNNKSRIWLGTFPTPEMAARAHDVAVLALKGEMARLNFPDSASVLPRAKSSSARDIQMAALQAAKVLPRAKSSSTSLPHVNCRENLLEQSVVDPSSFSSRKIVVEPSTDESIFVKCSNKVSGPSMAVFVDEEALFNMPGLLDSMAEGMLLTPPAMKRGFSWGDMAAGDMELTLWGD